MSLPACLCPCRLRVPYNPARFWKSLLDRALERIDGVVNGLDRRRRIGATVEENEHAARGFAHPHVVDVAHTSLLGGCCGERGLDAVREIRLRQLPAQLRLRRLDVGLDFDVVADFRRD